MSKWVVAAKSADFKKIADRFDIDPVVARVMRNRDLIDMDEMESFLYGEDDALHDPYLLPDMDKATEIILEAIDKGQHIRIIGDYDVDGVTSTYILYKGIEGLGGRVDYAIPHRVTDGYGVNEQLIRQAHEDGVELIVTCDNGIAAVDAFEVAKELGLRCLITDHHEVPYDEAKGERTYIYPYAEAIVNPKRHDSRYPYANICGAMVAYKLILALARRRHIEESLLKGLMEMAGFGTVCDVMELRDENRAVVRMALKSMNNTANLGIKALRAVNSIDDKPVSSYHLGFILGPCINATGRLDSAALSLELLLSTSYEDAVVKATELKNLNDLRKDLTEKGVKEAYDIIEREHMEDDRVLVVYHPTLHESLAGIVAGRIRERYYRPTFVITEGEDSLKGSGRSIETYHMYEELCKVSELLDKFGGHKMAAGVSFSKDKLEEFRRMLNDNCTLTEDDLEEKVVIDVPMPVGYVTEKLVRDLDVLEPFGPGNTKPVFADKNLRLMKARTMGKSGDMAKFTVADARGLTYEMVLFRGLDGMKEYASAKYDEASWDKLFADGYRGDDGLIMDMIYYPGINEFRGMRSLQYVIQDYK